MATPNTEEPQIMTPQDITESIQQRVGGGGIGQDFQSWRYNEPQGDFGTAYPKSRRKMRMEAEFQKYQLGELERQRQLQSLEMDRRRFDLQFQAEQRMQEKQRLDLDRESKVQDQAQMVMESIRGTTLPDGQRTRPINIEDDDAVERLQSVIYSSPFGMENQATKEAVTMMLNDALGMRERKLQASQEQELAAATLSARTGKPMEELGEYTEEGVFRPDLNAITEAQEQIKESEAQKAEDKTIRAERRRAEAAAEVSEKKGKKDAQREIQRNIRKATEDLRKVNASLAGRKSLSDTQRANLTAAKDALIDLQIERAALDDMVFENANAYGAALREGRTFPTGTTIYIGRTPVKVK
jgi:choline dehydrogenase-like flavoprotein